MGVDERVLRSFEVLGGRVDRKLHATKTFFLALLRLFSCSTSLSSDGVWDIRDESELECAVI